MFTFYTIGICTTLCLHYYTIGICTTLCLLLAYVQHCVYYWHMYNIVSTLLYYWHMYNSVSTLCYWYWFIGTIPREVGSQQNGSLERGGQIRYEFQVPTEGLELILCVSQGEIELYGSFTVSNPNAALHDYMYAVNSSDTVTCVDVVIEPPQTPGHNTINSSSASLDLDTIFISLEGIEEQNDFTIVTAEVTPEEGKPEITIPREGMCNYSTCDG